MKSEKCKIYTNSTGKKICIVGIVNTSAYGNCLVGEDIETGELLPVVVTLDGFALMKRKHHETLNHKGATMNDYTADCLYNAIKEYLTEHSLGDLFDFIAYFIRNNIEYSVRYDHE